ncbi:HlyB/MsbA family ABC transporter [Vallitalea longa]|uniref:HlyB/MsbA family ABC transporter n=1 Tax=Vallitalea longa TaxID=2936439 RepID=A0A9W5YD61_9FIRM|nr:ABC transporter ATP-binding protein [Vallitalea longa]GKX30395.1 HlyB/MsbA family ABC transporter [Vallitalea longa]
MLDKTNKIEEQLNNKVLKGSYKDIFRLFKYMFSSSFAACNVFMSFLILVSFLTPLSAYLWKILLDLIDSYGTNKSSIINIVLVLLGYYLIIYITDFLKRSTQVTGETAERLDVVQSNWLQCHLNKKIYTKLSNLSIELMEVPAINDIINRTLNYVGKPKGWGNSNLQMSVLLPFYNVIAKIISIVIISITLCVFSPWLCFIILLVPIPLIFTQMKVAERIFKVNRDNTIYYRKAEYYQDLLLKNAVKEVKTLRITNFLYNKWHDAVELYSKKEMSIQLKNQLINLFNITLNSLIGIFGSIFTITLLARGDISIGEFGCVMALINVLLGDTTSLFNNIGTILTKKLDCSQFFELIDIESEKAIGETIEEIHEINIDNISYRYPNTKRYVLRDVNIKINKGETIALVGENGAGKSTFVKLLTGILSPSKGEIYINSKPLSGCNINSYYNETSIVSQTPAKYYTFSVLDNVKMGDATRISDDEKAIEAIKFSGFTKEYNKILGKDIGGGELSGGEWQKVSIAKAYFKDKDVLVLDEPTSNLDPLAETEIFKKYMKMAEDKTVFIVTHRISLAALAERILVFKDGKIIETGNHKELIEKNGEYARLYNTQAKWYKR